MLNIFRSLALYCFFSVINSETYCPVVNNKGVDNRENKNNLRIMQYNVEWLFLDYYKSADCPGDGCTWKNESHAKTHLQEVANVINKFNPDIINLCEVEGCDELNTLKDELNSNTYESYMIKGTDTATGQNVGMISKINPISDLYRNNDRFDYPINGTTCTYTGTGTEGISKHFVSEFAINDINIVMISLHLLAFPTRQDRCVEREAQAKVAEEIIQSYAERNYEIIVIGDFNDYDPDILDLNNDTPISQVIDIIKGNHNDEYTLYNVNELVDQKYRYSNWWDKNNNCYSTSDELVLIDHIFLSKGLFDKVSTVSLYHGYYEDCERIDSDHFPIILDIVL
jgi:exonuclease III